MANPEHEAILRQGVEVWNKWQEDNPNVKSDFSGVILDSRNLGNVDFSRSQFNSENLSNPCWRLTA